MNKKLPLYLQSCHHFLKRNFKQHAFTFLTFLLLSFSAFAQGPGCPNVNAGTDVELDCEPCTNLTASFLNTGETTSYAVSSIPYDPPFPFTGGTPVSVNIDDRWSDAIQLPFEFCFFGETYSQMVIGSNAVVSFDLANNIPNTSCEWDFSESIPNPNLFFTTIFGPYMDVDPSIGGSGQINWTVFGESPCRTMVVNFPDIPYFDCNNLSLTSQVVIYETTNVVEVYVQDRPNGCSWNDGNAVLGIQNQNGTLGYTAPGRNTGDWSASNEAWRFTPNGVSNVAFSWLDASGTVIGTDPTINVCPTDQSTTYTAQAVYTNCNGDVVTETDEVTVTQIGSFTVDLGDDQELCETESYDITAEIIDGNPAEATFLWNTGETTQTITVSTSGTYTVEVTIGTCTIIASVVINFNELPLIDLGANVETCFYEPFVLDASPSNYNPADATYEWSLDGIILAGETSPTLNATQYGIYSVSVSVGGCLGTDEVTISQEQIQVSLGDDITTCFVEPVILTAEATDYDPNLASYEWSLDGVVLAGETNQTLTATEFGVYKVNVSVGSCIATDEASIAPNDLQVSLGDDFTSCFEMTEILTAEAIDYDPTIATYQWKLNGAIIADETNPTLDISQPGTYVVEVTVNSCTTTDSIIVGLGNINVSVNEDFQTCFDSEVILEATLGNPNSEAIYQWSLDGNIIAGETNSTLIITEIGTYSVTATVGSCTATDSVTVNYRDDLEVTLGDDFLTCANEPQILTATTIEEGATYQWFLNGTILNGETDSTLNFMIQPGTMGTQTYTVVIAIGGCSGTDSVDINLYAVGNCVISEGLSPNGDGFNDTLDLSFLHDRTGINKLQIFNRLGTQVYEANNYTNQWSGQTSDGNELPTGTYFYVIDLAGNDTVYGAQATGWIYLNQKAN
ncbi:gliding motility-associated C-terminal domain-containing protein [Aequorivita sp. SDUM287046]|uniref:Gliding motility-associated C-terminal domain-containing protein n=1 Tax=Aequorivita aurantiaca TaxID=3053356 RepID=A0ABT8DCP9_9FLAO|nr:gliding motility-associated C-terminal domain-containing protein [Aequorivita aurantiaca]MDN3722911.1 gliding motility-associated C-terminal domain-containing protein [Aequorivita aurantiaca]